MTNRNVRFLVFLTSIVLAVFLTQTNSAAQDNDDDWEGLTGLDYPSSLVLDNVKGQSIILRFKQNDFETIRFDYEYDLNPDDRFTSHWIKESVTVHNNENGGKVDVTLPGSRGKQALGGAKRFCFKLIGVQVGPTNTPGSYIDLSNKQRVCVP